MYIHVHVYTCRCYNDQCLYGQVSGLSRKHNYHARWEALIKKATTILNRMFLLAAKNPRNYIIDQVGLGGGGHLQCTYRYGHMHTKPCKVENAELPPPSLPLQTNVYASAQHRKISYFSGFPCKAVCVIPPHHELRKRTARRNEEMGLPVPEDAINAMKGESKWSVLAFGVATTSLSIHVELLSTYMYIYNVYIYMYMYIQGVYMCSITMLSRSRRCIYKYNYIRSIGMGFLILRFCSIVMNLEVAVLILVVYVYSGASLIRTIKRQT